MDKANSEAEQSRSRPELEMEVTTGIELGD